MSIGPKYEAYLKIKRDNAEINTWLNHIGRKGRGSDVLHLSKVHAAIKLVVAGQYSEGGTNYWDSPKAFNALLLKYIHDNFDEIRVVIEAQMRVSENEAKNETKAELEAALSELSAA